jgi:hypothetical protein
MPHVIKLHAERGVERADGAGEFHRAGSKMHAFYVKAMLMREVIDFGDVSGVGARLGSKLLA